MTYRRTSGVLMTRTLAALATLTAAAAVSLPLSTSTAAGASSHTPSSGDCVAARHDPRGAVALECRAAGWTVRPVLVVTPARVARYSSLPACTVEDGTGGPIPCAWNFPNVDTGDNMGRALYFTGTHTHPVRHFVTIGASL